MGIRSIVSFGLFIVPVAITIGVLLGIDLTRHASGQKSIFALPPVTKITTDLFCQLQYGFTPLPGRFTFNPNQWGVTSGDGNLCMNVTYYDNGTYPTNATSPSFSAVWQYDQGPEDQPVHAFPNAKIEIADITNTTTVQLSNMTSMPVDVSWAYIAGNVTTSTVDDTVGSLWRASMNANVCIDMFLDPTESKANSTETAAYEVMIWFGQFGNATDPIGFYNGTVTTQTIDGTTFDLYFGTNSNTQQKVFTWMAAANATDFKGDVYPMISDLSNYDGPTGADHLGYIAFGSEALYATGVVTFEVNSLSFDLVTG